ncbi:MAG: hypothetical protein H6721_28000 [Sandaracinus sp.]|nr:hypothetical protein [Myxococcales bacterium]MCB9615834.1 hypothetical protein [Sandaracinus sp.]MCB9635971.1 hypothetical protein [Sandaracinus sp.]
MNDFGDYLLFVGLVVGVALIGVPLYFGRARAERWGVRESKETVGDDPFRGGSVTRRTPRAAPGWVAAAAGLNAAWAALTLLMFTPFTLLVVAFTADTQQAPIAILLLSLTAIDGLVWPFVMMVAARRLLLRTKLDGVRRAVRWSYVHHGLGGMAMLAATLQSRLASQGPMLAIATAWATVGIAIAWSMNKAFERAQETKAEDERAVEHA